MGCTELFLSHTPAERRENKTTTKVIAIMLHIVQVISVLPHALHIFTNVYLVNDQYPFALANARNDFWRPVALPEVELCYSVCGWAARAQNSYTAHWNVA